MISNLPPTITDRLVIHRFAPRGDSSEFGRDVHLGLTSNPKILLPKYFYDDLGSHLFEAICCLPEYYVARAESEILKVHAEELISEVAGNAKIPIRPIRLMELGSGSADKTRYLLEELFRRQKAVEYFPIDISADSLGRSSDQLLKAYPGLRINAYAADYYTVLQSLAEAKAFSEEGTYRNVVLFFGSSIGNVEPAEARALLKRVRGILNPNDVLFVGADLKKSADVLLPAYNDVLGITGAFNLNLLLRINRDLAGEFDLTKFEHRAIYNEERSRIEMHLFSREAQSVTIRTIDLEVRFQQGESIHTENSYKFDLEQLSELARDTGFSLRKTWFDSARQLGINLFSAV